MADFEYASVDVFMKKKISSAEINIPVYEYGVVSDCNSDIIQIDGLGNVSYGEILEIESCGAFALALDLRLNGVGAVLINNKEKVESGAIVRGTGQVASICVGDNLLGRIIDPLGRPLDGKTLKCNEFVPVEVKAPSIMDRAPVKQSLQTGILSIDSMIPIGRGQRELIIGDRQTGKTTIAVSSIIHQTRENTGVICIYCAIGQKNSNVANVRHTLQVAQAYENCIIVSASAGDCAAMQYLAPYAACSIAEYFMHKGKDVLIIYDDLSKHAVAYRSMSLLLRRPAGREAYPGDVFYLHSRLLERATHLSEELGGGSITALPIVETMAGDISAYIPTNVISITDGQIYLQTDLFNSGMRPAIDVGLSVSRVGRSAQKKAMKNVSGGLRLEIAQYRDMSAFAQFGSELDSATSAMLHKGACLMELLKQSENTDYTLSEQCCILYSSECGLYENINASDVGNIKEKLLCFLHENYQQLLMNIDNTGDMTESIMNDCKDAIKEFSLLMVQKNAECS